MRVGGGVSAMHATACTIHLGMVSLIRNDLYPKLKRNPDELLLLRSHTIFTSEMCIYNQNYQHNLIKTSHIAGKSFSVNQVSGAG